MNTKRTGETTWLASVIAVENSDDLFLQWPEDFLKKVGWQIGDTLNFQITDRKQIIVTKMNKIYFKHTGLQIPDLFIEYFLDRENRKVEAKLNNHFDSALLLTFVQTIEETENICIVDNRSDNSIPPSLSDRYALEIELSGLVFEAHVVRIGSWLSRPGCQPNFTISMQLKK